MLPRAVSSITVEATVGAPTRPPLFFDNVDAVPHPVTAGTPDDPALDEFDSGLLTPGSNYALSFDEPGIYSLLCTLHPDMVATVTVD